jgi:hypothetical protein
LICLILDARVTFLKSLKDAHVDRPDERILSKLFSNFASQVLLVASSPNESYDLYQQVKGLPASLTLQAIQAQSFVNVNGPLNIERPYILTATDTRNSKQLMVKILRVNHDNFAVSREQQLAAIEREKLLCDVVASAVGLAFVSCEVIEITIDASETVHVGGAGSFSALKMPRYVTTVAEAAKFAIPALVGSARRMISALQYLHERSWAHMDVKGANIFVDTEGQWFLGDFGSTTKLGHSITTCTDCFYKSQLSSETIADPKYDWYMLCVTLCIESSPYKGNWVAKFTSPADSSPRINDAKLREYVRSVTDADLSSILNDLLRRHDI